MKSTLFAVAAVIALGALPVHAADRFQIKSLVSDGSIPASHTDPSLVNAWGVAYGPTGPFWISDNGTGASTLYNGAGAKIPLTVSIPASGAGAGAPTGMVFNGTASSFQIGGVKPAFLFDTEGGDIVGWAGAFGTTAAIAHTTPDAVYKGLAIDTAGSRLYAANFSAGTVDAFDSGFGSTLLGKFVDPTLPAGYAPFNVQNLGGELYVTYAKQVTGSDDEAHGAGLGLVDVYSLDGTFLRRIASVGDAVDAPWGLAIAPDSFRSLAGALLVGNFGDGTISAFDKMTGTFMGRLLGFDGDPLSIDGLWALTPGNGAAAGSPLKIYFTAGPGDESQGLFGSLTPIPEPATWMLAIAGLGLAGASLRRRRAAPA